MIHCPNLRKLPKLCCIRSLNGGGVTARGLIYSSCQNILCHNFFLISDFSTNLIVLLNPHVCAIMTNDWPIDHPFIHRFSSALQNKVTGAATESGTSLYPATLFSSFIGLLSCSQATGKHRKDRETNDWVIQEASWSATWAILSVSFQRGGAPSIWPS